MNLTDNHNLFTTVLLFDGRRIRVDNQSGETIEIAFDSPEIAPLAVPVAENLTSPVLDVLQPAKMPESVTDLATIIRDKKYRSIK